MESVGDEFRTQPLFKKININVNIVCKNQTVSAAAKLLRRVFRNLIRNACGALHSTLCPTINIEVNPSSFISPHVEIFVADNGPGVAGEILDKLLGPLNRLVRSTAPAFGWRCHDIL